MHSYICLHCNDNKLTNVDLVGWLVGCIEDFTSLHRYFSHIAT